MVQVRQLALIHTYILGGIANFPTNIQMVFLRHEIHTHWLSHTFPDSFTHIRLCIYTHSQIHIHTFTDSFTHIHVFIYTHSQIHIHTFTDSFTHIHVFIHTHPQIHLDITIFPTDIKVVFENHEIRTRSHTLILGEAHRSHSHTYRRWYRQLPDRHQKLFENHEPDHTHKF